MTRKRGPFLPAWSRSVPPRDEIGVRLSREPGVAQRLHRSRLARDDSTPTGSWTAPSSQSSRSRRAGSRRA